MRACVVLVALGVGVRLALALGTDVYFDETYYWQWARHLAWGYFDHPPLVAWLIAALGIRGTALLCGLGTGAAVWGLARDVYGSKDVAWRALSLWSVVPVGIISGVWATPDSPMLLFWALGLWALYREKWVLAGLTCGLALLAKYPSVLLGLAFMLAALRARRLPAGAWLTAGLALLCFLPVVLWNANHEWVGFAFQLNHGLGGTGGWKTFGEFVAGQLAMGGPLLFPLAVMYAVRGPREQFLLRMAAVVPLVFFGYAAARTRGEANWPAAAYLAACIGVAGMKHHWQRDTAWSGAIISLAVASHLLFPVLTFERDVLLSRTHGWSPLERLSAPEQLFAGMTPGRTAVYAPSYQLASQVAYYAGVETDTEGPARRKSQYDVWPPLELKPGQDVLWCSENGAPPPEELVQRFGSVEGPVELVGDFRDRRLHTFTVWRLGGMKPD
ncbi:4-amino-4-deoxy-L-arabinose transferase [Corallococcus terminator]|uniref:4-amino-4-deoxy-L-arabinose transferase n=2 Tax=Corallococcus terminator TaxID=2316733 RepID=A0A3A8JMS7_9BACT|nr:4-amino-4-deoxy-L-arabinose transferase [Corallococcus terminator]